VLVLVGVPLLGAVGLVGGFLFLRTERGNTWLQEHVEERVTAIMGEGDLSVGKITTNGATYVWIEDVVLTDGAGRQVVAVPEVRVRFNGIKLLTERTLEIERVLVTDPVVDLQVDDNGELDLSRMFPSDPDAPPKDPKQLPLKIDVQELRMDGAQVAYFKPATEPEGKDARYAVHELSMDAHVVGEGWAWVVSDLTASAMLEDPELGAFTAVGGVSYDVRGGLGLQDLSVEVADSKVAVDGALSGWKDQGLVLDLAVDADADMEGLEPLLGDIGVNGVLGLDAKVQGPMDALRVQGVLGAGPAGTAALDITLDTGGDEGLAYVGTIRPNELDLTQLLDAVTEPTVLSGEITLDGSGTQWPEGIGASGSVSLIEAVGWGYQVPEAYVDFVFAEGRFQLTGLHYESWWGRVDGDGLFTLELMDLDVVAEVWDARGLEEFNADGISGSVVAEGRFWADWSDSVTADFDGTLVGQDLGYQDYVTLQGYEGPVTMHYDKTATIVTGTEGLMTEVDASGVTLALAEADWDATIGSDGHITFGAELDAAIAQVWEIGTDGLSGPVSGYVRPDGHTYVEAELVLVRPFLERFDAETGLMVAKLDGDQVFADIRGYDAGNRVAFLLASGDLQTREFSMPEMVFGPRGGVQWKNQGPVTVALTESWVGADSVSLDMRSVAGRLAVTGRGDLEGDFDANLIIGDLSMPWLGYHFPKELGGWAGLVSADLHVGGDAAVPELTGNLSTLGFSIPGTLWGLNADVDLVAKGADIGFVGVLEDQAGPVVALRGHAPFDLNLNVLELLPHDPVTAEVVLLPVTLQRIEDLVPAAGELPPGRVSGLLLLDGTLMEPQITLEVGGDLAAGDPPEHVRLDVQAELLDDRLVLVGSGHQLGAHLVDLDGGVGVDTGALTRWLFLDGPEPAFADLGSWTHDLLLRVTPQRVDLHALDAFIDVPEALHGKLGGAVAVFGDPAAPQIGGALQLTEAWLDDAVQLAPVLLTLAPQPDAIGLGVTVGFSGDPAKIAENSFTINGTVPFQVRLDGEWDWKEEMKREGLKLDLGGELPLSLASLADPTITNAEGLLELSGDITGTLASPRPDLVLDMEGASMHHEGLQIAISDLDIDARALGSALTVDQIRFTGTELNPGLLSGQFAGGRQRLKCELEYGLTRGETLVFGTIGLDDLALSAMNLDLCANQALVSATAEMMLRFSSQLELRGVWPAVQVTGAVNADEVQMVLDESVFFSDSRLELDPSIELIRTQATVERSVEKAPPFWYHWPIALDVDLNRSAVLDVVLPLFDGYDEALKLSEIRLEDAVLDGVLEFTMFEDEIGMLGTVTMERGVLEVVNKDFDIAKGDIVFGGDDYLNPTVDIKASRDESQYGEINVYVQQTVNNPSLSFESVEGYSNTDILTILLLGIPTSEMGSDTAGLGLLAGQMTGVITEQFESAGLDLGLFDSVQVQSGQTALDAFVVGRSLSPRLYLETQINLVKDDDDPTLELTLDWIISRRLRMEFRRDDDVSADLFWVKQF
jgi:hypothetical protein